MHPVIFSAYFNVFQIFPEKGENSWQCFLHFRASESLSSNMLIWVEHTLNNRISAHKAQSQNYKRRSAWPYPLKGWQLFRHSCRWNNAEDTDPNNKMMGLLKNLTSWICGNQEKLQREIENNYSSSPNT